ncbi:MAG TPA: AAA family ATPase [Bacteroidia bacterium]|nr:AAA family ATPase [Bacteroidia bacterium]
MKQFTQAARSSCKIKLGLQGPSGSGKTYSALLLAYGLTNDWRKIAVIDSENGSANLYSDLGAYSVLNLTPPYTPEIYTEAIELAVKNGFECLIIDSMSAEWNGILDIHSNIPGNSFVNWGKILPRHNTFIQKMLDSNIHVIGTMRTKTEYVLSEKNGKQVPEKVGMKSVQREDTEYEFTIVFELNQKHQANVGKDRTGLFKNKPELILTTEVGKSIAEWCMTKPKTYADELHILETFPIQEEFEQRINECKSMEELINLYNTNPNQQVKHRDKFISRRNQINVQPETFINNGVHH